jgi:hypothetical protein
MNEERKAEGKRQRQDFLYATTTTSAAAGQKKKESSLGNYHIKYPHSDLLD